MASHVEDALSFDLEHYLSKLTLQPIIRGPFAPPMPPPNTRSTMAPLTLMPGGYRKLEVIEPTGNLDCEAAAYFSKLDILGSESFRGLMLQLQPDATRTDGEFNPYIVNNAMNVTNVLSRFLLRRIETLLHTVDGAMREWTFRRVHRPRRRVWESQSIDPIIFSRSDAPGNHNSVKFVLLSLGPWEFGPTDFHEFTTLERFDDTPNDPNDGWASRQWVNADRMIAYLYDLCLDFGCQYFAVSSYSQWCFGAFSKHYTTAFLSPPISFDNRPTSIVEILVYWIHAAFGKHNTIPIPNVEEELDMGPELLQQERQLHAKRFLDDGLSGAIPDLIDEESPPAKRRRVDLGDEDSQPKTKVPKANIAVMVRRRNPRRRYLKQHIAAKKRGKSGAKLGRNVSTESVISADLSVAPSCAERLPERLIPRRKNEAIQRWRNFVAIIEEHGEVPQDDASAGQGKWVDWLLCDPTTGEPTGDIGRVEDHTCSSCGPPSPTLSACSLSSEELARWNRPTDHDAFQGLIIHQWF